MSFVLKNAYVQSANLLDINAYDITGVGSTTNTTGYGYLTNPNVTDCISYTITCYEPDLTTLLPSSTAIATIDAFPNLPTTSGIPFALSSLAVLGETRAFTEGNWRFVVTSIFDDGISETTYTSDYTVPIFGSTLCCIQNKVLLFPLDDCCNDCNKKLIRLLKADLMIRQLIATSPRETGGLSPAEQCQLFNKMAEIIQFAKTVCDSDCSACASCSSC